MDAASLIGVAIAGMMAGYSLSKTSFEAKLYTKKTLLFRNRKEKVSHLKGYFFDNLCEDPIDGTNFDCDFLDFIQQMERKYNE